MTRRRLYYVPGLITLIGLPILFFIFKPEDDLRHPVLTLLLPSNDSSNTTSFSKAFIDSFLKTKKIEQVYLEDYDKTTHLLQPKFSYINQEVERLQLASDTTIVLQVKFGRTSTLGDFIELVDIATLNHIKRYVLYEDQFYFYANSLEENEAYANRTPWNYSAYSPDFNLEYSLNVFYWQLRYEYEALSYSVGQNRLLSISFLFFIFIPAIFRLVRCKGFSTQC